MRLLQHVYTAHRSAWYAAKPSADPHTCEGWRVIVGGKACLTEHKMRLRGVEPRSPRPQRDVLTTRRQPRMEAWRWAGTQGFQAVANPHTFFTLFHTFQISGLAPSLLRPDCPCGSVQRTPSAPTGGAHVACVCTVSAWPTHAAQHSLHASLASAADACTCYAGFERAPARL